MKWWSLCCRPQGSRPRARNPARLYLSQMLGDKRRPSATVPSHSHPPPLCSCSAIASPSRRSCCMDLCLSSLLAQPIAPPTLRSKEGAPVCALPGSTPALVLFSLPILLFVSSFLAPFVPRCSLPPLLMAPLSVSIHAPHPPPPHLSSGWAQEQRTGVVSF